MLYLTVLVMACPGFLMAAGDVTGCGSLMKKCVQCRSPIEKMVSFVVCCGGQRKSDSCICTPKLCGISMLSFLAARVVNASLQVCNPAYLVPVPSQDKLGGLRQEGRLA